MSAVDSSVLIAALASWHDAHDPCRAAAAGATGPAHVLVETYSVLTRLPAPHRISGATAGATIAARFPAGKMLVASPKLQRSIVARLARVGVEGGSVYDGLVGLTAAEHGHVLLTRDTRAVRTYDLLDVPHELVDVGLAS